MATATEFMTHAAAPSGGNSPWAQRYCAELRRIVVNHAGRAPRSNQAHLGPSELGAECDRQVIGKFAGVARTNHVSDPWASIIGTAVHAWLADAFTAANGDVLRWVAEQRVEPFPGHSGTADLYDADERAVVDHKVLGPTNLAKIKSGAPPRRYVVQLLLYALGYQRAGLDVRRVAIAAYPRTAHTLAGMHVWEHELTPADDALLAQVITQTQLRKRVAAEVVAGRLPIESVPASPDDNECFFCPYYRPESARDNGPGCPGTVKGF